MEEYVEAGREEHDGMSSDSPDNVDPGFSYGPREFGDYQADEIDLEIL